MADRRNRSFFSCSANEAAASSNNRSCSLCSLLTVDPAGGSDASIFARNGTEPFNDDVDDDELELVTGSEADVEEDAADDECIAGFELQ